jgi:hypothetical protein
MFFILQRIHIVKFFKLVSVLATVLFTSTALPARADTTIALGNPELWALESLCQVYGGYNYRVYGKEINSRFGVCGVDNADDRLVEISAICRTQFSGAEGVYWFWHDPNQNMCYGNSYINRDDRGKGSSTIRTGGADQEPQYKVVGTIGHDQLWSFCSSNGYRSYYDHGGQLQCGHQEWVNGQPEGDWFTYQNVCERIYPGSANYIGQNSNNTCMSPV